MANQPKQLSAFATALSAKVLPADCSGSFHRFSQDLKKLGNDHQESKHTFFFTYTSKAYQTKQLP